MLSGRVYVPDDIDEQTTSTSLVQNETILQTNQHNEDEDDDEDEDEDDDDGDGENDTAQRMQLNQEDIYKEFQLRGYEYRNLFRQVLRSNYSGK